MIYLILAVAQGLFVPQPLSVTQADLDAAIAAATPAPCSAPLADTLTGSAGSAPVCMTRPDATRPTVVQAQDTTTANDATWSVTFDKAFAAPPRYVDARIYGAADPYLCTVVTASATGASGKCFRLVATTLPSVVTAVAGTVVSPFAAAGGALPVRVIARQ